VGVAWTIGFLAIGFVARRPLFLSGKHPWFGIAQTARFLSAMHAQIDIAPRSATSVSVGEVSMAWYRPNRTVSVSHACAD
jgi:hypothetical protein